MAALRRHLVAYVLVYVLTTLGVLCQDEEEPNLVVCLSTTCKLPDCFCPGRVIPNGLKADEIPQMVLFTFDDAVNDQVFSSLLAMFGLEHGRKNPNGSPIAMTLFVSHTYTDYCKVAQMYRDGHEIASHSITHKLPINYWKDAPYDEYDTEIDGQRQFLSSLAGIPKNEIRGYRSPFIQPGGDTQFNVLMDRNFTYDSSLLVFSHGAEDRRWPYTLDVPYQIQCAINPCPMKSHPGLWELPIQPIPDHTGELCSFLDRCVEAEEEEQVYDYLSASFNASYESNRGPLILNMHAAWFRENVYGLRAFVHFIEDLVAMDDVYIITSTQLIDWMRTPTKLENLPDFKPWKWTKKRTSLCSKKILRDGPREKKEDFSAYRSKLEEELNKVNDFAPEDGGRTIVLITIFAAFFCFLYLLYKEEE